MFRIQRSASGRCHHEWNFNLVEHPSKASAPGSADNGGELLFLSLATCYCNAIYREAAKLGIDVDRVDDVFGSVGEPDRNGKYHTTVAADGSRRDIEDLVRHTLTVAKHSLQVSDPDHHLRVFVDFRAYHPVRPDRNYEFPKVP